MRIGFVDDRLDNFHADVFLDAIRGPLAARGFDVAGAWALNEGPSRAWAQRRGVAYFDDLVSLGQIVDRFMILAPATPQAHLDLCRRVFPWKKPTYVDKPFAPSEEVAQRILELADRAGVAVQSSSALRYANVVAQIKNLATPLRRLSVWGGGTSFEEYGIHPTELAVAILGADVVAATVLNCGDHRLICVRYADERTATIHVNVTAHMPYLAAATTDDETTVLPVDDSRLFVDTAASILDFFETGVPSIDRRETLLVRRLLDLAADSMRFGSWTPLDGELRTTTIPRPKFADRRESTSGGVSDSH